MRNRLWNSGAALLVLGTFFWSSNFVVGRALRDDIGPLALSFWRWFVACLVLLPFAWQYLRRDAPLLLQSWKRVTALAVLGISVFNTLVYLGLHSTTVVNGVLMQSAMPVVILLGSFVILGERVHWLRLVAVAISLGGVVVIVARGSIEALLALRINPGDVLIFIAVCLYALYSILLRGRPKVHPLSLLAATIGIGACFLLPAYAAELAITGPFQPTPTILTAIAYVAIFPSILSFLFFNRAVELIGANHAGHFLHLMPVYGSILAAIFLHETLHLYHVAGAALIAAGILVATFTARLTPRRMDNTPPQ